MRDVMAQELWMSDEDAAELERLNPTAPPPASMSTPEAAIAVVRAKHPRIRKGAWHASWTPDAKRAEESCWWVANEQGRKSGRRDWIVNPYTGEIEEA